MDFSFLKSSLVVNHFQGSQHWSNKVLYVFSILSKYDDCNVGLLGISSGYYSFPKSTVNNASNLEFILSICGGACCHALDRN